MRVWLALPLILFLAACADEQVAAPTEAENAQLDEAANMLDNLAEPEPAKR